VITAIGFLRRAIAHSASYGITTERLITHNGNAYRSTIHAIACRAFGICHIRTQPYRPQTNGKPIHPHHARRMGLRRDLPLKRRTQTPPSPARSTSRIAADHTRPQPQATLNPRAEQPSRVLQLALISAEDRLDVDDWRAVDRLEVADADPVAVDGDVDNTDVERAAKVIRLVHRRTDFYSIETYDALRALTGYSSP
jgi:hypothetical protein